MSPQISLVITTRNRKDALRRAIDSALAQTVTVDLVVMDDGSTDGTSESIGGQFPGVRLFHVERSLGCVAQRNRGAERANAPIVAFMDDDAVFSSPHVLADALADFDSPRVGVVAIPFRNLRTESHMRHAAPSRDGVFVAPTYSGGASALRRDLFLRLGGYRTAYVEQNEESDYTLRLLERGYVVRLGRGDSILHFQERRGGDRQQRSFYGARNEILFAWHNVPGRHLPWRLGVATIKMLLIGLRRGHPVPVLRGLLRGLRDALANPASRAPIARAYSLNRRLRRRGPVPLRAIEALLPPLQG